MIAFAAVEGERSSKALLGLIGGFHIRDALDAVATKNRGLSLNSGAMPWPPVLASRLIS